MASPRVSRNLSNSVIGVALVFAVGLAVCATTAEEAAKPKAEAGAEGPYKVLKTFPVGGESRWDFLTVDPEGKRLFISFGDETLVLNSETGEKIGAIPDTKGVHGIALVPEVGRGFTSNGGSNTLTVFDLKSLKTLLTVKAEGSPDFIMYDPATKRVFALGNHGHVITAVKADTQGDAADIATLAVDGAPESGATDGQGTIYVNLEDADKILKIDAKAMKVVETWPTDPGKTPTGLVLDKDHGHLFCSCHNDMMILVDVATGKVLDNAPIGTGTDSAGFDPKSGFAFSSNRDGTLTVLREEPAGKLKVVQNVQTAEGSKTMALDPQSGLVYLPGAKFAAAPASAPAAAEGAAKGEGKGGAKGKAGGAGRARPSVVPGSFMVLVVGK
ncbi:MAG: YncE family protein [Candidatus Sumerlaeota bacterium]|nr:YncE family protein [Candidatus Sumerlaeota bacterium]